MADESFCWRLGDAAARALVVVAAAAVAAAARHSPTTTNRQAAAAAAAATTTTKKEICRSNWRIDHIFMPLAAAAAAVAAAAQIGNHAHTSNNKKKNVHSSRMTSKTGVHTIRAKNRCAHTKAERTTRPQRKRIVAFTGATLINSHFARSPSATRCVSSARARAQTADSTGQPLMTATTPRARVLLTAARIAAVAR